MEEHLKHLEVVLHLLRQNQLFAKRSKCEFSQPQVEYLGHIIAGDGVSTDENKVAAMVDWPQPVTLKELRGFLGLTGYYRKSFQELKQAMTVAPVLALPDFNKPFILEVDACNIGVGAKMQDEGDPSSKRHQGLSTYEKELIALSCDG
ncbi:uncharacterized mitochondrial protein AtMg00860-like [Lycium ferocissimum]|uniref:uncharacterized mitochondrial protein AtMg00860-like n=1 Tax=Lycium ferocissimum TaxID=112874 RepID=UPI002815DAAB|nr:uncharacterized mitochondrial protein AtMg00860-like [Lycium ferocissimum]